MKRADGAGLTREIIVNEALALLDEAGLADVSLRKVAARLGVKAPSLYWHIRDRDDLQAWMTETVFRTVYETVGDQPDWRSWLLALGEKMWETHCKVRDSAQLLISGVPPERIAAMSADICEILRRYGIGREMALRMHTSVQALIVGWSGFAHGPNRAFTHEKMDVEASVRQSLHALIDGWAQHLPPPAIADNQDGSKFVTTE